MSKDITLRIDFSAAVAWRDVPAAMSRFFAWWGSQLASLLPKKWRDSLGRMADTTTMTVRDGQWILEADGTEPLNFDTTLPIYELREAIALQAPQILSSRIQVIVPEEKILLRRITLPVAAASRLRSIVALQLDKLSPFRSDDVQFDCRIVEPLNPPPAYVPALNITVEVGVVSKDVLGELETQIREAGLTPRVFCVENSTLAFPVVGLPWTKRQQSHMLIAAGGTLLWLLAFLLAPAMQEAEISSLTAESEALAPKVSHAMRLRDELARYQLPGRALSPDRTPALEILSDLTTHLPDTVHLHSMNLSGTRLSLEGTAPDTVQPEIALKKSRLLSDVKKLPAGGSPGLFRIEANIHPRAEARN